MPIVYSGYGMRCELIMNTGIQNRYSVVFFPRLSKMFKLGSH
jgi:hypothetical protein